VTPRALLLVSILDGSGPGSVMATLARSLPSIGWEPILVSTHGPTDSPLIRETRAAGVSVAGLGMGSMWDPRGVRRFASLLRETRPDIVHTRTIRADLLGRVATAFGSSVINNTVNLYPDDCLVRLGPVVGRGVMALTIATAGAVEMFVANSSAVADNTTRAFRVPRRRVHVVLDGIDVDPWAAAVPADLSDHLIHDGDTVCLTVARLHPQKGLTDLVEAAAEVLRGRDDIRFVVAGGGPSRSVVEEQIRASGLEGRVVLLGERRDVPALLARADLFVLPSRFEGLPTALIEAMAAGRPIVATDVGGNAEVVTEETGWIVPAERPSALARAITDALDSDLGAIGRRARRRAEQHFTAGMMARAYAKLYEGMIERRQASRGTRGWRARSADRRGVRESSTSEPSVATPRVASSSRRSPTSA
jgi:glycosyltransferase involved in cell wall biosynthesis